MPVCLCAGRDRDILTLSLQLCPWLHLPSVTKKKNQGSDRRENTIVVIITAYELVGMYVVPFVSCFLLWFYVLLLRADRKLCKSR
jgi:hypothetical protein